MRILRCQALHGHRYYYLIFYSTGILYVINNPDASVGVCCSHKVVAVGFNTLRYDASVGVLNPPHE